MLYLVSVHLHGTKSLENGQMDRWIVIVFTQFSALLRKERELHIMFSV